MFWTTISPTKEKLYHAALKLFYEFGYDNVSMRELAKEVGIKNTSVYNHFKSKEEILYGLYQIYTHQRLKILPKLSKLLKLAETLPVYDVLIMMDYHFPAQIEENMNQILAIGVRMMSTDPDSMKFIENNVFRTSKELIIPVITKFIELEKIEPIDIEAFNSLIMHYCFSAVALVATPKNLDHVKWKKGLEYLYTSLIKPTGK